MEHSIKNSVKQATRRRPEKLMMRVEKGCIKPADHYTEEQLRARGYRVGDIIAAVLTKPRNPGFHRLAHRIGTMVAANIESFTGMSAHAVLKRLQIEARIGCEEIGIKVPGYGYVIQFLPRSLGFESMSEDEFRPVVAGFCRHIAAEYWPDLSPEKIEEMAECWVGEV